MALDNDDPKLRVEATDHELDQGTVGSSSPVVKRATLQDALAALPPSDATASQEEVERCYERLTQREREVFNCIMVEMTDKEMARNLGITPKTAEHYRRSVLNKMNAPGARELRRMVKSAC